MRLRTFSSVFTMLRGFVLLNHVGFFLFFLIETIIHFSAYTRRHGKAHGLYSDVSERKGGRGRAREAREGSWTGLESHPAPASRTRPTGQLAVPGDFLPLPVSVMLKWFPTGTSGTDKMPQAGLRARVSP